MVDQYRDFADERLCIGCTYCGGRDETVDHVPSRVFLDEPFPTNLPVVPSCGACNRAFAKDEEYVACLLEAVVAGSVEPDRMRRPRIARTLRHSARLQSMIAAGRTEDASQVSWQFDDRRIRNVVLKLARGHAAFEQSLVFRTEPNHYAFCSLDSLTASDRSAFEAPDIPQLWGEVGSRSMQRAVIVELKLRAEDGTVSTAGFPLNDWVEVQAGRYSYLTAVTHHGVAVRMVIAGFLACEVVWMDNP